MKKILLITVFAGIAGAMYAQPKNGGTGKKWFAEIGFSTTLLQPSDGDLKVFLGAAFRGGGYISRKSYLGGEVDFGGLANAKQAGTFSYTQTINGGSPTYHTDGKITQNYSATPVLVFWDYAPDLSKKLHFNIGPVVGITPFHSSYKFDPDVEKKPTMPSATKVGFNYGAETGFLYDVFDVGNSCTGAVGIRYRFLENSGAAFDDEKLQGSMHQINLVLNLSFKKSTTANRYNNINRYNKKIKK